MRKYRVSAASSVRYEYGIELSAGLGLFDETKGYEPAFSTLNEDLNNAYETRRKKRIELVKIRVKVRLGNYLIDQVIRQCAKAAEIADGGRRGPIFIALFPEGVGPVVAPAGTRQIPPTEDLLTRMKVSKVAAMDAFRKEWTPKLEAGLSPLKDAGAAYTAARKAYLDAFAEEIALRDEHFSAVDKLMGHVRAAFPGDKVRQDLVFPVMDDADSVEATGDETAAEEPPAGNAEGKAEPK